MSKAVAMCPFCFGIGGTIDPEFAEKPWKGDYVKCDYCCAIGMDPIPWSELFRDGRGPGWVKNK